MFLFSQHFGSHFVQTISYYQRQPSTSLNHCNSRSAKIRLPCRKLRPFPIRTTIVSSIADGFCAHNRCVASPSDAVCLPEKQRHSRAMVFIAKTVQVLKGLI